ncbi:MAG: formimidoylglutamate deiminase [Planctomycetaceae bacterium]|nr:formimidoylglutamate deiminase [Planctomycetaceae bacterium]
MNQASPEQILRPRLLVLEGGRIETDHEVVISGDRIQAIRPATGPSDWAACLLPGFVNGHSHAFQRGMRGQGESYPDGAGSFFTWRESMYRLVDSLDPDRCHEITKRCFEEMLDAGITTVGEFHYVHHGADVGRDHALDEAVVQAAADAGIRLVLLHVDYVRGGFDDRPLAGGQRRFDGGSLQEFLASYQRVAELCRGPLATAAPISHSTRAVPVDRIVAVREAARNLGTVFHIHLEEVVAEIDDCRESHGTTPMRLLLDHGVIDERVTAIHCTHSNPSDLRDYASAGGRICLCPNTEGNLGDGIPDLVTIRETGIPLSIGTDLNSRIAPAEDLRWIEYVQRIHRTMRGAVVAEARSGPPLLAIGTAHGAESLGIQAGAIAPGRLADFVAIDLEHRTLEAVDADSMLEAIVFGTGPEAVTGTCVGGRWVRGGPNG